jgi:hypothetical protein
MCSTSQNVHIWAKQIPHFLEAAAQHLLHSMMWVGVTSKVITGSYLFYVTVTGESYLEMFHCLIPELDNAGLLNIVILQNDGVPANYAPNAHAFHCGLANTDLSSGPTS